MLRLRRRKRAWERDERWPALGSPFCFLAMAAAAVFISIVSMGCKNPSSPAAPAGPPIPTVTVANGSPEGCPDLRPGSWDYGWIRQRSNTAESVRLSA